MSSETKVRRRGSRIDVLEGRALLTSGGLTKDDLMVNPKTGRVASKKEMERGTHLRELLKTKEEPVIHEEVPEEAPITVEVELPASVDEPKKKTRKPRAKKQAELTQ